TPSRFSDERALELSGVVVRAGYRGRGVGRELVHEAGRCAAGPGGRWGAAGGEAEDLRPQPGSDGVLGGPRLHRPGRAAHEPHEGPAGAARRPLTGTPPARKQGGPGTNPPPRLVCTTDL